MPHLAHGRGDRALGARLARSSEVALGLAAGLQGAPAMTKILGVFVLAAMLAGCGALQYSDSETTDVEEIQDDQKGEHPDEPIIE
jgi:hypothetical protein